MRVVLVWVDSPQNNVTMSAVIFVLRHVLKRVSVLRFSSSDFIASSLLNKLSKLYFSVYFLKDFVTAKVNYTV